MLGSVQRQACHGVRGLWLRQVTTSIERRTYATSLESAIKISSIPAPHSGSITVLSLNRPKARNALSRQLVSELNGIVEGLHAEGSKSSTRALILASESDHAFCAGADLKERLDMSQQE
jgi:methylglutaconyl-CoA hydratase